MPDICDLVLDDHEQFRRRFAELDDKRAQNATAELLAAVWQPLAGMLERHASAEEELFYPRLLRKGANAGEETEDAISDHNDIRAAVNRAAAAEPGSHDWWAAVLDARDTNSDHIAEEERESLPDFREHVALDTRNQLGARWMAFAQQHAGASGLETQQEDVQTYLDRHGGSSRQ